MSMDRDPLADDRPAQDRPGQDRASDDRTVLEGRSIATLLSDLTGETTALLRKEMELARAELSEKAGEAGRGAISLAIGGGIAFAGLLFLLLAATYALALVLPAWAAALIVGGVVALIGLIMISRGRSKLTADNLQPRRTIETIRDDGRWARAQTRAVGSETKGTGTA